MSQITLFQMWGPFRQSLIERHQFYFAQARKRLLSQFPDLEAEADQASEEWLKAAEPHFDPERHSPEDFYEAALESGSELYELLNDLQERTRLSVLAGMFHEWDKQLRDWLVREIQHWHHGENVAQKVWAVDFKDMFDLLDALGWNMRGQSFFESLDACRLVVNVFKHGRGKSFDDLKARFPEYLGAAEESDAYIDFADHTFLSVTDAQLQAFAEAIEAFWRAVPENTFSEDTLNVPDWFGRAFLKDRTI